MVIWVYREEPIKVSYHPAKFGGHGYWVSEDKIIIVWHGIF